jgi:hypothetical protein
MQESPPGNSSSNLSGILLSFASGFSSFLVKPVFWIISAIFICTVGIGYWLGTNVVLSDNQPLLAVIDNNASAERVITLLEVSDLTMDTPELLSIWFIHLSPDDQPRLGFTPVSSISMPDDPNFKLLSQFSLDKNGNPSVEFLNSLRKLKVDSTGYVVVDQVSAAAFINWFTGKGLDEALALEAHSMTEYGQVLRSMCNAFPGIAKKGISEFPWTKYGPDHIRLSLSFTQVIENTAFLTSSNSPRCEMVPLTIK